MSQLKTDKHLEHSRHEVIEGNNAPPVSGQTQKATQYKIPQTGNDQNRQVVREGRKRVGGVEESGSDGQGC